jgi:hypothetical protein
MDIDRVKETLLGVTNPTEQWRLLMLELLEYHSEKYPDDTMTKERSTEIINGAMAVMVKKGVVTLDEDGKYMVPNINIMMDS